MVAQCFQFETFSVFTKRLKKKNNLLFVNYSPQSPKLSMNRGNYLERELFPIGLLRVRGLRPVMFKLR